MSRTSCDRGTAEAKIFADGSLEKSGKRAIYLEENGAETIQYKSWNDFHFRLMNFLTVVHFLYVLFSVIALGLFSRPSLN
jgi:hypothetical protein